MYTYRQIFKQAFKVALQRPSLWFFGFFAALLGVAAEIELLIGGSNLGIEGVFISLFTGLAEGGFFTAAGLQGLVQTLFSNPITLFLLVFIFLTIIGLTVVLIWLAVVSQSAIIGQTINISRNQESAWRQNFDLGLMKFWPVLGLNALMRISIWILFGIIGVLSIFTFPGSAAIYIIGFDIFLVLVLIISFMTKYSICAAVLQNKTIIDSIRSAWEIFKKNWLLSLEVAIILFFIYWITSSIVFIVLFSAFIYVLQWFAGFVFGLIFFIVLILALFLLFQIVLTIFHWAVWAIIFELLTVDQPTLVSRIKSGFDKVTSKNF